MRRAGLFAEVVRAQRRRLGWTQDELAAAAGLSVRAVRKIETGRTNAPRLATVRLLADAFGLVDADRESFCQSAGDEPAHPLTRPRVPAHLPAAVSGFAGRTEQLAYLNAVLATANGQPNAVIILTMSGTAGVGKTALAVRWAHQAIDHFPDGQLFVNLRGFDPSKSAMTPAEAVRGLLDTLGVPAERIPADLDGQAALYRSLIAGRRILVLLDNARDAEQVRPLLPGSATTVVLVTSRNRLTPLIATEGARSLDLDLLPAEEARELLASRLGSRRVAAEPEAVDSVIAACASLPLALAIVAARAQQTGFPLATIGDELHDGSRRLDALDAGDASSQIRTVLSWSYTALAPPAARLFRLLGVHPEADVTLTAAASLAGCPPVQARRLLSELLSASLLTEHTPGRYTRHDLLRVFASERAEVDASDDDRRTALTRLLDHYTHTSYAANQLLDPLRDPIVIPLGQPTPETAVEHVADHQAAMDWFDSELRVLVATVRLAAEAGFDINVCQLAWTLNTFLDRRGYWRDQAVVGRTALDSARRLGNVAAQALAHRLIASANAGLGRYHEAQIDLQRALDLYARVGDQLGKANTHRGLAFLGELQERPQQALRHAKEALEIFRAVGDRASIARILNNVGWCHGLLGDYVRTIDNCEQALTLLQELGDQYGVAHTWDSLGYAHHHIGHHAQSVDSYQRALDLYRQLGASFDQAVSLSNLGDAQYASGNPNAARDAWRQAVDFLTELDHPDAAAIQSKLDGLTTDAC